MFVVTFGNGVKSYILDRNKNLFIDAKIETSIPEDTREYAVNASNARHWEKRMKNYIDDSIAGKSGPRGIDFNMRWVASLVAETHRILSRGGIFIYPADSRKGYEKGRLRMVYECAPIAFLIEQAGGAATDSFNRILDLEVDELHQRTPFRFWFKMKLLDCKLIMIYLRLKFHHYLANVDYLVINKRIFMSTKILSFSVVGSSGAGTSTVKDTFEKIF